jgi:hypothetical protein
MADDPRAGIDEPLLLNRYRVEGKLGEGGLGTVVKAFDTRLKSMRAIKTLKRTITTDPAVFRWHEERFIREAEAGSRMGINPNLVAVYDLVTDTDATLYLLMEFVPGGTLADRLKRGAVPLGQALRWTADAARGLQAAHDVGVVHRDVKPANIFIAADGRAQVGDFGIAQIDDLSQRTQTAVGHPGTPLYTSPEQTGTTAYLTPASDQYSLGLVLFGMLTGVPYRRLGAREAQARLAAMPEPVAVLIARMTADDPEDRYPSLAAVVAAVQEIEHDSLPNTRAPAPPGAWIDGSEESTHLTPETIHRAETGGTPPVNLQPRPPVASLPAPSQTARGSGRGALIGVCALILVTIIVVGGYAAFRSGLTARHARTATATAASVATSTGSATLAAIARVNPTTQPSAKGGPLRVGQVTVLESGTTGTVQGIAWSPDSTRIAAFENSGDNAVLLWNADRTLRRALTGHTDQVTAVAWSADRMMFASAALDNTTILWIADGQGRTVTLVGGSPFAWAPDGKHIATTDGGQVKVWDVAGVQSATMPARVEGGLTVTALTWSPDGAMLTVGTSLGEVRLYRADGTLVKTLTGHTDLVSALAWSPDGKVLASGANDGFARLWKADGTLIATLPHNSPIESVAWSPNSATLATSDGKTRLWTADGTPLTTFADSTRLPAWSPDGTVVAVAHDNDVELWRPNGTLITALSGHTSTVESLVWAPDGKTLASGSGDGTIRLWH